MRVAESMVIFGPICHVGWARASFTEALASSSRDHPLNGPPEAVMTTRLRSSRRSPRRHWARAECSESTGTSRSGSPFTRSMISSPPTTRDSLLARASIFPDWRAASDGGSPTAPTMAFRTMSASDSLARVSLAAGPEVLLELVRGLGVGDGHEGRHEFADLPDEQLMAGPLGAQPNHAELIRIPPDHVQCLSTDRAGRPEDGQGAHDLEVTPRYRLCRGTGPNMGLGPEERLTRAKRSA